MIYLLGLRISCSDVCVDSIRKDPSHILVRADSDGDGVNDCVDGCPSDATKTAPGVCGCGVSEDICRGMTPACDRSIDLPEEGSARPPSSVAMPPTVSSVPQPPPAAPLSTQTEAATTSLPRRSGMHSSLDVTDSAGYGYGADFWYGYGDVI